MALERSNVPNMQTEEKLEFHSMGDGTLVVQFEYVIDPKVNKKVQTLRKVIIEQLPNIIINAVPSFNNLTIIYNMQRISFEELRKEILKLKENVTEISIESRLIKIPVVFSEKDSPDLKMIAKHSNQPIEDVIQYFTTNKFFTYMIGFIAGYPYSGNIDERYALARRKEPRIRVPKGSVQIANRLTGIATLPAPSGWHIIGRTPMEMFDETENPPSYIHPGDYIQYVSISDEESISWDRTSQKEWDARWNASR